MKFILPPAFIMAVIVLGCHTGKVDRSAPVDSLSLIELTVVSTNDLKPLDNVTVSWWAYLTNVEGIVQEQTNAFTGTDGVARMRVPAGMYSYSISKINWLPSVFQITIKAGQTTNLTIQLAPAPRISGIVRDPSGAPAVGVRVAYHPGSYPGASEYAEITTDANGRFQLVLQSRSSTLWGSWDGWVNMTNFIMARDLEKNLAAIEEFAGTPRNVDLTLQPGIILSGSVKDIQGVPLTNATVEIRFQIGDSLETVEEAPVRTGAQGLFSIPALPQGREYSAWDVTAKGFGSASGHLEAKDSQTNRYEYPTFVLKAANRKLAGRVVDINWKPLAGAWVSFSGRGQPRDSSTNTDNKGNFVFDSVCDGPVKLDASYLDPRDNDIFMRPVGGDNIDAHAGDTNILIQLHDPSTPSTDAPTLITKGNVFDPSGKPSSGVSFVVWRSENPFRSYWSDSDGKYRVRWQHMGMPAGYPGGNINSVLVARDTEHNLTASHDLKKSTTTLNMHLKPGCVLSGSVQDADGQPLTNATVSLDLTLNYAAGELAKTQVDTNGLFCFNALPRKGEYTLDVTATGYGSVETKTNFAKSGQAIQLPFKLTLANLQIAGTVLGPDGRPVPGMTVNTWGQNQMPVTSAVTDANGHFAFDQVAGGPIMVTVRQILVTRDGRYCNSYVNAMGGDTNIVLKLAHP